MRRDPGLHQNGALLGVKSVFRTEYYGEFDLSPSWILTHCSFEVCKTCEVTRTILKSSENAPNLMNVSFLDEKNDLWNLHLNGQLKIQDL